MRATVREGREKSSKPGKFGHAPRKGLVSLCQCGRHKRVREERPSETMWDKLTNQVDLGDPTSLLDQNFWGVRSEKASQI